MKNNTLQKHAGLIALIAFFIAWGLRATVLYFIDEAVPSGAPRLLFSTAVKLGLWVVPAVVFVWLVRRKPALPYLGFVEPVSARAWGTAALIAAAYMGTLIGLEVAFGGKSFTPAWPTAIAFLFLTVSCLIEETLFRGLILHDLSERFRGRYANLICSALFVGVHLPHWLYSRGLDSALIADGVGVFLVSLLFGVLYLRTRSIWPCFLAHVLNNLIAGWLGAG